MPYATGQIFSSLIFNLFMSKIQRRISGYAVFEQLIYGVSSNPNPLNKGEDLWPIAACPYQPKTGAVTRLFRIEPVPEVCQGKPYGEAFAYMVRTVGAIPVGLLAMREGTEPVVLTNPKVHPNTYTRYRYIRYPGLHPSP